MKSALLTAALCLGVLSVPVMAHAGDLTSADLQNCVKEPSMGCLEHFAKFSKVIDDAGKGRKPTIALPASPSLDALPIAELAKLLSK